MRFKSLDYYKDCNINIAELEKINRLTNVRGELVELNRFCGNTFISKLEEDLSTGCWNFTGFLEAGGYGKLSVGNNKNSRSVKAHRFAYYLFNQISPDVFQVMHSCDNPACCSPFHLSLGTHKQNMEDKTQKRRNNCARGEANNKTRFTDKDVVEIVLRYNKLRDYTAVAREFDTVHGVIRSIILSNTRSKNAGLDSTLLIGNDSKDAPLTEYITGNTQPVNNHTTKLCYQDRLGAANPNAKLTQNLVDLIREEYATVKNYNTLARKYNVSGVLVGLIIRNKIWVTNKPIYKKKDKFTQEEMQQIRDRYTVLKSYSKVAAELDIGKHKVATIIQGFTLVQ